MDDVPTYTATAAYPYANRERATSALRGALRLEIPVAEAADWATFEVAGPVEGIDGRGRPWFEWTGTVVAAR